MVIAESDLNDVKLIEQYGLDGSWADDLHHAIHVALTGESQGYYADFQDQMPKMVAALERGWFYEGQHKPTFGRKHGTPAAHLRARHFVVCAQNHDQIGNRARGERLTALTDEGGLRAAAAVIALQPALPLYFQGEEWAAREPFQYFVSHTDPALVEAVRRGRFSWIGGGRHRTSTTHVDNVIEGLLAGAGRGTPGEVYFVTDGEPAVFRDFVTELLATRGVEIPDKNVPRGVVRALAAVSETAWRLLPLPGAPPITRFSVWVASLDCTIDISKARRELGYAPVKTREQGLEELRAAGAQAAPASG